MKRPLLYPLFHRLEGQPVLVVGAGRVATRRIARLVDAGAVVRVVSPRASREVEAWNARAQLEWTAREARDDDVQGVVLVLTATGDRALAARLGELARARGILFSSAEDQTLGDVQIPALAAAGDVRLAISTSGANPALSRALREEAERWLESRIAPEGDGVRLNAAVDAAIDAPASLPDEIVGAEAPSRGPRLAKPQAGTVYLVGAGPGDPGHLTLRAAQLLGLADVVYYDRLVGDEVLELISPDTERVYVGKELGCDRVDIPALLIRAARDRRVVVRLKGGDPVLFGRAGEEMLALREAGVPFELVPGVSALCAVPGSAMIPVTYRGVASELVVRSGHRMEAPFDPDRAIRERIEETTYVYFMAVNRLDRVVADLRSEGLPASTPCAIVERGTLPGSRVLTSTLGEIDGLARSAAARPPALLIAGDVVRFRDLRSFRDLLEERGLASLAFEPAISLDGGPTTRSMPEPSPEGNE